MMRWLRNIVKVVISLLAVAVVLIVVLIFMRDDYQQFESYVVATSAVQPGEVRVQFVGNTNLLISDGATSLMIDGWFSRPSIFSLITSEISPDLNAISSSLKRARVSTLAAVIPVHSHHDHAMDAPEVAKRTGALLIGSESTANIARGWGLNESQIRVVENSSPYQLGDFSVSLIPGKHYEFPNAKLREAALADIHITQPLVPPVKVSEYKMGGAYSIHIQHPQGSMLIHASAGFAPGALNDLKVDALFLGVGGIAGQTDSYQNAYWQHVVTATGPTKIFPIHFDSLTDPLADQPVMPNLLVSKVFKAEGANGIIYVIDQAKSSTIEVGLLPMWQDVAVLK